MACSRCGGSLSFCPECGRFSTERNQHQTTFGYGQDHFSQDHAAHKFGSTAPVQRDFGLNMPDGSFQPLVGVPSPPSVLPYQTTLDRFRR